MAPIERKADAAEITKLLQSLSEQEWIKGNREWWPKFIFHYTDVRNAVEILKREQLLCRSELDRQSGMIIDNASRLVIANTSDYVRDFVRLYFRPQTPTQFRNEGIRPRDKRELESHCPVPVFFLFDSIDILTRKDSQFSEGNLAAAGTQLCRTASELATFDFRKIYHVGTFQPHLRDSIIYHRNAEVVVPTEMDLSSLKYIFCRSPAEKDTLLNLLQPEAFLTWSRKILIASKSQLYNCNWTFVETGELSATRVVITFSPDTTTPGPFSMEALITDINTERQYRYHDEEFYANTRLLIRVPEGVGRYNVSLTLDGDLAFAHDFYGAEVPF